MNEQFDLNNLNPDGEYGEEFPSLAMLVFVDGPKQVKAYGPTIEKRTLRISELPTKWNGKKESLPVSEFPHDLARTILALDEVWTVADRMKAESTMDNHFRRYIAASKIEHHPTYTNHVFEIQTPYCD